MRIAVDTRGINHIFKGGVNEYTISLLNEMLKNQNIDFDLLTSGLDVSNRRAVSRLFTSPHAHVQTINIPNKILNGLILTLGEPKLDGAGKTPPDLLFMPNLNTLAKKRKTPLVVTFHDVSYEIYDNFFSQKMKIWHSMVSPKSIAKQADRIIAVSESTKQDLIELYKVPEQKISVIYPGISSVYQPIDISSQAESRKIEAIQKKYQLPREYILYLGTLEPRKNVGQVIDAFQAVAAKYPDLNLVIAGKRGWLFESILTKAQESPFASRIHFTGFVEESDKVYLYNLAKFFVYPSFYEGFGFPVLEAMSCGVPVITSHVSSLPEVTEGNALTISPYNVHELIWAIEQLMDNDEVYQEFVLRSIKMKDRYRWNSSAQKTIEIFKGLK